MRTLHFFGIFFLIAMNTVYADCGKPKEYVGCCAGMGGISYCDSSAGRFICKSGEFSSCYCTRHAVMDLQKFEGCCMWQGGVMQIDPKGLVICRNGGVSELCTRQDPKEAIALW